MVYGTRLGLKRAPLCTHGPSACPAQVGAREKVRGRRRLAWKCAKEGHSIHLDYGTHVAQNCEWGIGYRHNVPHVNARPVPRTGGLLNSATASEARHKISKTGPDTGVILRLEEEQVSPKRHDTRITPQELFVVC